MVVDQRLEYATEARRHFAPWLLIAAGSLFVAAALSVGPARHCTEGPCPLWLRAAIGVIGGLSVLGGAAGLVRNTAWGSSVDLERRTLSWWHGNHRTVVPLAALRVVQVKTSSDSTRVTLITESGTHEVTTECLPYPLEGWLSALMERVPGIEVRRLE